MKFKKGLKFMALLAAVALLCGSLAGCGSKSDNGKTQFSVGAWPSKEGDDKAKWDAAKVEFETENPEFEIIPDNWAFDIKSFYPKAAAGQLPTVYTTHFTEVAQIISAGYSADITDQLKESGVYDYFNPQILDLVSKDGRVYAYPYTAYILGLGYNVDLFEAAGLMEADGTPKQPKNWDEVAEFAVKIKEATGKAGIVFPTANNNGGWIFMPVAWSYGVDFMEQDADGNWKATFDTPEAVATLQYNNDLKWKYDVLPSNTLIDGTEYYKVFGTGGAGMMICADPSTRVIQYGMQPNQIGMMAMPAGPKKHVTLMGGSIIAVSNNTTEEQVEGAVKWIKHFYGSPIIEDADETRKKTEENIDLELANNHLVGLKPMSIWTDKTEATKIRNEVVDAKTNINMNHVRLYNEFSADLGDCELRAEEPVCCQELYGVLDGCIQEVLSNKDADCASLIKKACSDFQANYLDNMD